MILSLAHGYTNGYSSSALMGSGAVETPSGTREEKSQVGAAKAMFHMTPVISFDLSVCGGAGNGQFLFSSQPSSLCSIHWEVSRADLGLGLQNLSYLVLLPLGGGCVAEFR